MKILASEPFSAGKPRRAILRVRSWRSRSGANYFSVFGVQPAQGRPFMAHEETQPAPVAIVSHRQVSTRGLAGSGRPEPALTGMVGHLVGIAPKGSPGRSLFFSTDLYCLCSISPALKAQAIHCRIGTGTT
jgi:hypothetical protein